MKDGLKYIVGKQIAGVVVASSARQPRGQVFLVFTDGARFEFWGESFSCCAGLDSAADIERYVESLQGKIDRVYTDADESTSPTLSTGGESPPYYVAAADSIGSQLARDLAAWREARALIHRAKGN